MYSENVTMCKGFDNIINLSETCLNTFNHTFYECIKDNDGIKSILRKLMGSWSLFILLFGALGNLLTLLAIPHAAKQKRHGLDRNYQTTTVFVLHLALVDLLCSLVLGPIYASTYLPELWPWGSTTCKMVFPITVSVLFVDWISLSFVALSRYINLTKPVLWSNFCENRLNLGLIIGFIWISGGITAILYILEPRTIFGWDCESGQCSKIKTSNEKKLNWLAIVGLFIPIVMIVFSYAGIFFHVRQTSKYLRADIGSSSHRFDERELKMTWSILVVFFCYIFCAAPHIILVVLDQKASYQWIIGNAPYLMLFIANFLVYSYQNEQYKKAFSDYLKMLKYLLSNGSLDDYRSSHNEESIRLYNLRKPPKATEC